ncbi:hypothetical protein Gotur_004702 [Gossypium turneri]
MPKSSSNIQLDANKIPPIRKHIMLSKFVIRVTKAQLKLKNVMGSNYHKAQ